MQAGTFVQVIEERQGLKIGCIEEVAYHMGFITAAQLQAIAEPLMKSGYGQYLLNLLRPAFLQFQFLSQSTKENTRWRNRQQTASGLQYVDEVVGEGPARRPGQKVTVHYTGTFPDGRKFDSSRDRGRPLSLSSEKGRVIKGWDEGVLTMKVGGRRILTVP